MSLVLYLTNMCPNTLAVNMYKKSNSRILKYIGNGRCFVLEAESRDGKSSSRWHSLVPLEPPPKYHSPDLNDDGQSSSVASGIVILKSLLSP